MQTVKITAKIIIQINLYMHFLTLDEVQPSTIRSVQRIISVYTYSVYFRNFIYRLLNCATIFVNCILYFIMVTPVCTVSGTNEY